MKIRQNSDISLYFLSKQFFFQKYFPLLTFVFSNLHNFVLWNTKENILKNVAVQIKLQAFDFHCSDKKRLCSTEESYTDLEQHE